MQLLVWSIALAITVSAQQPTFRKLDPKVYEPYLGTYKLSLKCHDIVYTEKCPDSPELTLSRFPVSNLVRCFLNRAVLINPPCNLVRRSEFTA
jgi:hypothetical protein